MNGVTLVLGLDFLLLLTAVAVIAFALKCPGWMRLLLYFAYIGTLGALFLLPGQIFPSLGPLNGPLHFVIPWLVSGAVFLAYRVLR